MRIDEHVYPNGVGDELLRDVGGHESLIKSSLREVHPIIVCALVAHDKSPVQIPLYGFGARGEVEHELVEACNVILGL